MNLQPLTPFGVEIAAPAADAPLESIPRFEITTLLKEHRLAVLRGFSAPAEEQMLSFCRELGTILEWEFGAVNELQVREEARNYLYTNREVPFHWDGAFLGKIPHYIFFHCPRAPEPGSGGETTFCDTPRLLADVPPGERERWEQIRITYRTEKVVHYGGEFTSPLLAPHPVSGECVLRFAEPVADLNPVTLSIEGIPEEEHAHFLARMHALLNDPSYCYAHAWRAGDILLADNHALLHGRRAMAAGAVRHLRRVNIL